MCLCAHTHLASTLLPLSYWALLVRTYCALLMQHPCLHRDLSARSSLTGSARPPSAACLRTRSARHKLSQSQMWSFPFWLERLSRKRAPAFTSCDPIFPSQCLSCACHSFCRNPFVVDMKRCLVHFQRFVAEKLLYGSSVFMLLWVHCKKKWGTLFQFKVAFCIDMISDLMQVLVADPCVCRPSLCCNSWTWTPECVCQVISSLFVL